MNNITKSIFRTGYQILGPDKSSMLAYGKLGTLLLKMMYRNINTKRVFYSNENIILKLSPKEASLLGLLYFGSINQTETELIKNLLRPGGVFVDVGTYIDGWHSLVASKVVGKYGLIYSFEPHPKYFSQFKENIKLNKLRNIKAENIALSNKNGKSNFYTQENISSFYHKHITKNIRKSEVDAQKIVVRTTTLDNYVKSNKIKEISLIKIDVECAEMEVLLGAKRVLKNIGPDLLLEVVDSYLKTAGGSEEQILKFLKDFGYKAYTFEGSLKPFTGKKRTSLNLFFSKKRLQELKTFD